MTTEALDLLGREYVSRILPYVNVTRFTVVSWKARGKIPEAHRAAVVRAVEAHTRHLLDSLSELRGEPIKTVLARLASEEVTP
jgi:hypothetical protein